MKMTAMFFRGIASYSYSYWASATWLFIIATLVVPPIQPCNAATPATTTDTKSSSSSSSSHLTPSQHLAAQISWIESHGGYFSSKISYHPVKPNDPTSHHAMHVMEPVDKDEVLIVIPHQCIFTATGDSDDGQEDSNNGGFCSTVDKLAREYELGTNSDYFPYVNYCFDERFDGDIPQTWSTDGKALLTRIAGRDLIGDEKFDVAGMEYKDLCGWYKEDLTENELKAYLHVLRRSWDDKMLPVLDMINHRNPPYLNVDSNSPHEEGTTTNDIHVTAIRDIAAGEELHNSYNECTDCMFEKDYAFNYGTHKLVRDYGFVEDYPQRWAMFKGELWFGLEEKVPFVRTTENMDAMEEDGHGHYSGSGSPLELVWFDGPLSRRDMDELDLEVYLHGHLKLLRDIPVEELTKDLRSHEAYTCIQFHKSLITAIKHLLWYIEDYNDDADVGGTDSHPVIYGTGDKPLKLYTVTDDDWTYSNETTGKDGSSSLLEYDVKFNHQTCPDEYLDKILMVTGDDVSEEYSPRYERIGKVQSFHQLMTFWQSKEGDYEDKDVVMKIERNWESCHSNRAHYHELFVHYPASYISEVKRVMFLGGGDNMILHEVLKYESLEVVVGLELDKGVNQGSFVYFETLPHYDDSRVEWWFGDAKKSLQLLPKSYLASFDLIIVDMQNKIIDFLNIMEDVHRYAHPTHGVIVRNEDRGWGTNVPFAVHNVDYYDGDVPVFCHQPFTMGSNVVDFTTATRTLHEDVAAKNVYYGPVVPMGDLFDNWYNYRRENKFGAVQSLSPPSISAGILMVLELEQVQTEGNSADVISNALKGAGVSILEAHVSNSANGAKKMAFTAKEGYVLVRAFPEEQYYSFDVKLWSSQEKMNTIKESLVKALGSKVASSYRIVSAGIAGVMSTDQNDKAGDDTQANLSDCKEGECKATDIDPAVSLVTATEKVLSSIVSPQESEILVLCGEAFERCEVANTAKKYSPSSTVTIIHACPVSTPVFDCDSKIRASIRSIAKREKKVDAILIDSLAPKQSGQNLHRIFSRAEYRDSVLSETVVVASLRVENTSQASSSAWLRVLLDEFRTVFYPYNPSFHSEVIFYPPDRSESGLRASIFSRIFYSPDRSESGLRASIFSANNGNFYENIVTIVGEIISATGLVSDIQYVKNGMNNYAADFVPTIEFGRKSYSDRIAARAQRTEQKFMGRQTVWQYEAKGKQSEYTSTTIMSQVERVLSLMEIKKDDEIISAKIGDGVIIFGMFEGGDVSVLYDGKSRLDVNLFTLNQDKQVHDNFEQQFAKTVPLVSLELGDMQPRGSGRVVAFEEDYVK